LNARSNYLKDVPTSESTGGSRARRRRRPRGRPKKDANRNRLTRVEILKSAAAAFRKLGYHGATVEQIAAALHMKKGNLYYYFRNKEEILYACHQYSLDQLLDSLDAALHSQANAADKLRQLVSSAVHLILDELHGTALLIDLEALSPAHLRALIARRDEFDAGLRQIIEEGMRTGIFERGDVKLLSLAMLGAINWIPRWYRPDGPSSSEEISDRFADYLVGGLAAARASR
jgi:AcrR family transcriptional regulator